MNADPGLDQALKEIVTEYRTKKEEVETENVKLRRWAACSSERITDLMKRVGELEGTLRRIRNNPCDCPMGSGWYASLVQHRADCHSTIADLALETT